MESQEYEQQPHVAHWKKAVTAGVAAVATITTLYVIHTEHEQAQAITALQNQDAADENRAKELATILAASNGVGVDTVMGDGLKPVTTLPGYKDTIADADRSNFQKSVFVLGTKLKGDQYSYWSPSCTAEKVLVNGLTRVLTAAHCIDEGKSGYMPIHDKGAVPFLHAVNVMSTTAYTYGVFAADGFTHHTASQPEPLATAVEVAKDVDGIDDWALLRVTSGNATFDAAPAIPIQQVVDSHPKPGEPAALYSVPAASGDKPLQASGVYLGRWPSSVFTGGYSQEYDYVGVTAATPEVDPCNYGASGSIAHFADGSDSGPLSLRSNMGYGKAYTLQIGSGDNVNFGVASRLHLEELSHLDLSRFTTICAYTAGAESDLSNVEQQIEHPTPVTLPPIEYGKGA